MASSKHSSLASGTNLSNIPSGDLLQMSPDETVPLSAAFSSRNEEDMDYDRSSGRPLSSCQFSSQIFLQNHSMVQTSVLHIPVALVGTLGSTIFGGVSVS